MAQVLPFPTAHATFTVEVTFDRQSSMWVGVCDGLLLATEAPSFDALVARVWEIAPEMARENGLNIPAQCLRLVFQHETGQAARAG